ncbi:Tetraspanin/Peripherin protein [Dioscorea alata]|uniref:Tetraspanin/Peripherin protein n=1 Tax=Dioscorea alata TaxID=55571 RepID=A0ACB7VL28_DIOAL|nr:Tetraspanin/Peripherin protein [Dioscorea alata]
MAQALHPVSILSYILSLPLIATSIWLLYTRDYGCEELLRMPRLRFGMGLGLLMLFLLSNAVVSITSRRLLLPGFLLMVVSLIIMFTVGLALVGNYKMENRGVPASPLWLENRVGNEDVWINIKTCIFQSDICTDLTSRTVQLNSVEFSMNKYSPIESGCCTPPVLCGMGYVNATYWKPAQKNGVNNSKSSSYSETHVTPKDCNIWSNEPNQLCYNCQSCKSGFLKTIEQRWTRVGVFLIVMAVILFVVHVIRFLGLMLAYH